MNVSPVFTVVLYYVSFCKQLCVITRLRTPMAGPRGGERAWFLILALMSFII